MRNSTENIIASGISSNLTDSQKQTIRTNIGSSGLILQQTAINDTAVVFNDLDTLGFTEYFIRFDELVASSQNDLIAQVSTDNGVSFDSGAGDYNYTVNGGVPTAASFVVMIGGLTADSYGKYSGEVKVKNIQSTAFTTIETDYSGWLTSSSMQRNNYFGGRINNQADNAIRLTLDGVKTFSGTFTLYGVLK